MATATKTAPKASKPLKPAARPGNLPEVKKPTIDVPVELTFEGDAPTLKETFAWAEGVRDAYQENGQRLHPVGLRAYAEQFEDAGLQKLVKGQLKEIYAAEIAAGAGGKPTAAATNGKPSANGKTTAKPAKEKAEASEATPLKLNNKSGIPVDCSEGGSGRKRCTIFEYPMRNVIRTLGKKQWTNDEIEAALKKMGIGENYHDDLRKSIIVPHAAAGRGLKANEDDTVYGKIAPLSKEQFAALEKLRK